ncbi:acyl-CoA dehydrogenase family protein [Alteromonas gracilis]
MATRVTRLAGNDEQQALFDLTREIVSKELAPRADAAEAAKEFPAEAYRTLGQAGLMSLPFDEEHGGGGQPYSSYLQVIEEIAAGWASVAVGTTVHAMTCLVVDRNATDEQRATWLPRMLSGDWLGAYCLSEPQAGSDVSAMRAKARLDGDHYVLDGVKQWISNGGHADYYIVFARTSEDRTRGISCFIVPRDTEGLSFGAPEQKMGLHSDPTTQVILEGARVPVENRLGEEGQGMRIALGALDNGRLGIAAVATGIAQASLAAAVEWAGERQQFGRPIGEFQGLQFLLADMAVAVEQARASYLHAARLKDEGLPFSRQASIAKLAATDAAMKVSTDAVQVLGGYGYTADFPVERYFRDAKVTQIFEGTNQIQRMVIARDLLS